MGRIMVQDYFAPLMMWIAAAIIIAINCIIIFNYPLIICFIALIITIIIIGPILDLIERKCK